MTLTLMANRDAKRVNRRLIEGLREEGSFFFMPSGEGCVGVRWRDRTGTLVEEQGVIGAKGKSDNAISRSVIWIYS